VREYCFGDGVGGDVYVECVYICLFVRVFLGCGVEYYVDEEVCWFGRVVLLEDVGGDLDQI